MNRESQSLLEAVLAESLAADFQDQSLTATLNAVRHHRRMRQWRRGGAVVALLLALPSAVWWLRMSATPTQPATAPSVTMVASQPLPASMVVETRPDTVAIVTSTRAGFTVVATDPVRGAVPELTDDELLQLVAGRAAALVRENGEVRLVIADARPSGP